MLLLRHTACCSIAGCAKDHLGYDSHWYRCFCQGMSIGSARLLIGIVPRCRHVPCAFLPGATAVTAKKNKSGLIDDKMRKGPLKILENRGL